MAARDARCPHKSRQSSPSDSQPPAPRHPSPEAHGALGHGRGSRRASPAWSPPCREQLARRRRQALSARQPHRRGAPPAATRHPVAACPRLAAPRAVPHPESPAGVALDTHARRQRSSRLVETRRRACGGNQRNTSALVLPGTAFCARQRLDKVGQMPWQPALGRAELVCSEGAATKDRSGGVE